MNTIKTNSILDPNIQQPFTGPSLEFLQARAVEIAQAYAWNVMGDSLFWYKTSNAGVIISGATKTGGGNTIMAGYIFFRGELYFFSGGTGLLSYTNPPVVVPDTTYDPSIDPVEFSDNIFRSVHQVRRLKLADQATVVYGEFLLSDMGRFVHPTQQTSGPISTSSATAEALLSYTSPNRPARLKVTLSGDLSWLTTPSSVDGGYLILRNATTSTDVKSSLVQFSDPVGAVYGVRMATSFTYIIDAVPAGTILKMQIKRFATSDPTINNAIMTVEEVKEVLW